MEIDIRSTRQLACQYNTLQLILAICHQATASVVDMTGDMIHDENFVKDNGMPTKAGITSQIEDWLNAVIPEMMSDELPDEYVKNEDENGMMFLFRSCLTEMIKQNPTLLKIEFQPR
jgi:hypothetical protein